jgi:hypothetical protein
MSVPTIDAGRWVGHFQLCNWFCASDAQLSAASIIDLKIKLIVLERKDWPQFPFADERFKIRQVGSVNDMAVAFVAVFPASPRQSNLVRSAEAASMKGFFHIVTIWEAINHPIPRWHHVRLPSANQAGGFGFIGCFNPCPWWRI